MRPATAARSPRRSGTLADIDAVLGDTETAAEHLDESLTLFVEFGDRWFSGLVLESAAFLAAGSATPSGRRASSAPRTPCWEPSAYPLWHGFGHVTTAFSMRRADALGESRFTAAWEDGKRLPLGATVDLVKAARTRVEAKCPMA